MGFGEPFKGQKYDAIKKGLIKSGEQFKDPEFSASQKSIFYSKSDPEIVWKRPTEMCKVPKLIIEGTSCDDLQEGDYGNRWFVAACASVALHKPLFNKIVPNLAEQEYSPNSYHPGIFKFNFWVFGKWMEVVVDDLLPTKHGRLVFCHSSSRNEFWSALLEKAYAKLFGDYESLSHCYAVDALIDFTGGVAERIDLSDKDNEHNQISIFNQLSEALENNALIITEIRDESIEAQTNVIAPTNTQTNNADVLVLSQQVNDGMQPGLVATPPPPKTAPRTQASTVRPLTSVIDRDGFATDNGLLLCHGYNVREFRTIEFQGKRLKMVRVQSPWQCGEWNGPWSNTSPEMQKLKPQEKDKLGLKFATESDFWMLYSDFISQFNSIEVCHFVNTSTFSLKKKWTETMLHGEWSTSVSTMDNRAGGASEETVLQNPQYVFDVSESTQIMCCVEQNDRTVTRKADRQILNHIIGLLLIKVEDNRKHRLHYISSVGKKMGLEFKQSEFAPRRNIFYKAPVRAGRYVIIPCTQHPHQDGNFLLRLYNGTKGVAKPLTIDAPKTSVCTKPFSEVVVISILHADDIPIDKGPVMCYAKVTCDGETYKTGKGQSPKPVWWTQYMFYRKQANVNKPITIQVYSVVNLVKHLIGEATISEFGSSEPSNQKLSLFVKSKKKDQADVELSSTISIRVCCSDNLAEF